jgi:transposase InsO family protein
MPSHVQGMKIRDLKSALDCNTCAEGKMTHVKVPKISQRSRATKPLELVHCDLAGPIKPQTTTGRQYALCFTDDFSGVKFIYFLTLKSHAGNALKQFLADIAPYGQMKTLRSDGGGEFMGDFKNILKDNRVAHQTSAAYTPQQNGVENPVQHRTLQSH